MRFFGLIVFICIAVPFAAAAHGGFEKRAGDTVVYVTQTPLSPFVGEEVRLNMVFQDANSLERWKNIPVQINLIDTYYGDETKDKVIAVTTTTTDINGSLNFSYTFTKENYFDVDLHFTNPKTGKTEETGFLIQPRSDHRPSWVKGVTYAIFAAASCFGLGIYFGRKKKRGKTETEALS